MSAVAKVSNVLACTMDEFQHFAGAKERDGVQRDLPCQVFSLTINIYSPFFHTHPIFWYISKKNKTNDQRGFLCGAFLR